MKHDALVVAILFFLSTVVQAQQPKPAMIAEDGGFQERGSCRVLYWNPREDKALGQFAIDYGRPLWKKDYEDQAKFDGMTKGKTWRLGKDFWTALDTSLPLKIASKDVPVGYYYLGLQRSANGDTWSLALIDPLKARSAQLDPFQIDRAPIQFQIPMTLEQAKEINGKLTITLSHTKENPKNVKLRIAWGKLQLSAPIQVTVGS